MSFTEEPMESVENEFQIPKDVEMKGENSIGGGSNSPTKIEPKPTPAVTKRKKFKDLFQSPSDMLVSPMSKTLSGKTHPVLLKQKSVPKRLNNLKGESETSNIDNPAQKN